MIVLGVRYGSVYAARQINAMPWQACQRLPNRLPCRRRLLQLWQERRPAWPLAALNPCCCTASCYDHVLLEASQGAANICVTWHQQPGLYHHRPQGDITTGKYHSSQGDTCYHSGWQPPNPAPGGLAAGNTQLGGLEVQAVAD